MKFTLYIKDDEGTYNGAAEVEAQGVHSGRRAWDSPSPDQHGTDMPWEYDGKRDIVLSPLGVLLADCERYFLRAFKIGFDEVKVYFDPIEPQERPKRTPLFDLGRIVLTPGALDAIAQAAQSPSEFTGRHHAGDWGDLCHSDKRENDLAVKAGDLRILSSYTTKRGEKIWCITEADRSATTLLLPTEY
jgi:hypothetical protein